MRRWGLLISLFYAVVLLGLLLPGIGVVLGQSWAKAYRDAYGSWAWLWAVALIVGQVLLFLPIDRSPADLRPRAPVAVTAAGMGVALGGLAVALLFSLMAAAYGDNNWPAGINEHLDSLLFIGGSWLAGWCVWAAVFYLYCRRDPSRAGNAVRWLIKGSVLELLVAVPAHVIVRRRDDCCAPAVTGFGIATGTAVMLMCLGPGVLALYRRRMLAYRRRS